MKSLVGQVCSCKKIRLIFIIQVYQTSQCTYERISFCLINTRKNVRRLRFLCVLDVSLRQTQLRGNGVYVSKVFFGGMVRITRSSISRKRWLQIKLITCRLSCLIKGIRPEDVFFAQGIIFTRFSWIASFSEWWQTWWKELDVPQLPSTSELALEISQGDPRLFFAYVLWDGSFKTTLITHSLWLLTTTTSNSFLPGPPFCLWVIDLLSTTQPTNRRRRRKNQSGKNNPTLERSGM